ncbi:hypothetical protein [Blastococcus sp. SYSU D00820]
MDRRRPALVALLLFVVLTGAAIAVAGSRPATGEGTVPWLLQTIGYLCAVAGGVLLLSGSGQGSRAVGGVVMAATVVMVLIDGMTLLADGQGADIGGGFVRLLCLVVIGVVTARLAVAVAADRRSAL